MSVDQHIREAETLLSARQPEQARARLEAVIAEHGARADALTLLGRAHLGAGRPQDALGAFEAAAKLDPGFGLAPYYLGRMAHQARDMARAGRYYQQAIACAPPPRDAFVQLANLQFQAQAPFDALETMGQAEAAFPDDSELTFIRGRLAASAAPLWHIPMLADTARNDAYDAAIKAVVKPGDIVLDIGTGSGLLAMMAARAGARHVYACEGNQMLAGLAQKIVAQNGFADRITVLAKQSTDLVVGRDLPQRADVLTTEIFDNAIVGEGALPTFRHAWAELLAPDARIIPQSATLYGALVSCPHHRAFHELGTVSGFDLSAMTALAHPLGYKDMEADGVDGTVRILSETARLQHFDFTASPPERFESQTEVALIGAGALHSIALWFELDLADGVVFSTETTGPHQHWRKTYQILPQTLMGDASQRARIELVYDRYFDFDVMLTG